MLLLSTTISGLGILIGAAIVFVIVMAIIKPGTPLGWFTYERRNYTTGTKETHLVERVAAHPDERRKAWWLPFGARKGTIRSEPVFMDQEGGLSKVTDKRMLLAGHSYFRTEIIDGQEVKVWCQDNVDVTELFDKGYTDDEIRDKLNL